MTALEKDKTLVVIERMTHDDVHDAMAIDRLSFPTPWSENAYRNELGNVNAFYLVARIAGPAGSGAGSPITGQLLGYAGCWIVMDEAHITTLAVHPDYRRHGIGGRLLTALLQEGASRGVQRATLEVRETNHSAQSLYTRFGFEPIARRRRYYSDTDEDAIVMWIERLGAGVQALRCSDVEEVQPEHLNA